MELSGCGTALVTPFGGDGAVDEAALVRLVNWQIESGINFLIPCGTTGEASTLSEAEWLRVVDLTVADGCGAGAGVWRMHAQLDQRGSGAGEEAGEGAGADRHPDGESVLQPARAGGPVPALPRDCGGGGTADPAV